MNKLVSWVRWVTVVGSFAVGACASNTASTAARPTAARSKPPPAAAAPAAAREPEPLSAYERRWQAACTDPEAFGRCPAPFDRPGVFFDVKGTGEYAPPGMCDVSAQTTDPATAAALEPKRKALRACFRGAKQGAWVDLVSDGSRPATAAAELAPRTVDCVSKLVRRALPNLGPASVKRVVVLNAGGKAEDEPTLSKERVTAMIASHADEVSACYDGALAVWPGLKGRHAPRVVIWFDGSVALVRTQQSSLGNPALECCINTAVRSWQFGPPEDGNIVIVTLPFVLGPQQ